MSTLAELMKISQALTAFVPIIGPSLPGSYQQVTQSDPLAFFPNAVIVKGYYIPINYDANTNTITAA